MNDRDFKLKFRDEQIANLKAVLAGTITETGNYNITEHKWKINTSSILTRLIQEAGRWCEHYASDLFILWEYDIRQKLDNGTLKTENFVFAMYNNGVNHKEAYENNINNKHYYRAVWFLDVTTDEGKIKMVLHK